MRHRRPAEPPPWGPGPEHGYAEPSGNHVARTAGSYHKWPLVTWDLAAERWTMSRCDFVVAHCRSCPWQHFEPVLDRPERKFVAEVIIQAQHWYSCEAGKRAPPDEIQLRIAGLAGIPVLGLNDDFGYEFPFRPV